MCSLDMMTDFFLSLSLFFPSQERNKHQYPTPWRSDELNFWDSIQLPLENWLYDIAMIHSVSAFFT